MKKAISVLLAATAAFSSAALLTGCGGDSDYPVEVANLTIEKEPENVVVLDASTADIMAYMDYERKFVGRSEAVTQAELAAAPVVGSAVDPDINKIVDLGTDLVFCDDSLSKESKVRLTDKGIQVVTLQQPQTEFDVKTNYDTVGRVLEGKNKGAEAGTESYEKLVAELEKLKRGVEGKSGTGALYTVCYLYLKNNKLAKLPAESYGNVLMDYTNCVNIFSAGTSSTSDISKVVSGANPNFIFYNDEATLKALKADPTLAKTTAVASNKTMQIPLSVLSRPGITAVSTVKAMNAFIYDGKVTTPEPTKAPAATQPATQAASQATAQAASQAATQTPTQATTQAASQTASQTGEDVSSQYAIDLSNLSLALDDESSAVEAMQKRLFDLGFIKKEGDDTNITGYFGKVTESAVKAFQKANGIPETGKADNATLILIFSSAAKKAE